MERISDDVSQEMPGKTSKSLCNSLWMMPSGVQISFLNDSNSL